MHDCGNVSDYLYARKMHDTVRPNRVKSYKMPSITRLAQKLTACVVITKVKLLTCSSF
jgi:hypothetical protein